MIDRKKVIKALEDAYVTDGVIKMSIQVRDVLVALLKEQEAKTGHWIEKEDYAFDTYYDCSVCGESWSTIEGTPWENGMNYCPHCGAKMEGR